MAQKLIPQRPISLFDPNPPAGRTTGLTLDSDSFKMAKSIADFSSISNSCWDNDGQELAADEPLLESLAPVIFGRATETQLLLETFQQVVATRKAATVVVHGESGSGKTSLVDTLRVPVIKHGGYFCAGKFFQISALQEPYSAIMAAFSDICDMVAQSDDFSNKRKIEIREAIGAHGYLLRTVISNISSLLGDAPDSADASMQISNDSSFSKLKVACKTFLQAVSSDEHPLVLFIDDIQWMDVGSREMIHLFLSDKELENVLLIFAYREEEAESIIGMFQTSHEIVDMSLSLLDASAIYELICATFRPIQPEAFRELSILTESRSSGNPFHVQAFLAMIQMEGFLTYDKQTQAWIFDVDDIRSSVMMRNTLADLLARKIELIGANIKDTLKIASLIGYHFDEPLLLAATSHFMTGKQELVEANGSITSSRASVSLMEAVGIGFIEKTGGGFQFTHDKIQTAFREMIGSQEEIQHIHHIIGQAILNLGDDNDATMYRAVVHSNAAPRAITCEPDVYRSVHMNLHAAKYCMSKSAFETASDLLQFGLEMMDSSQRWSDSFFALSFEMTELLAKAELVIGHFENSKKATREALLHAKSTEMKINSLLLDVEIRMANNELDQIIPSANKALLELGVKMPTRVTKRHVLMKFLRVKFMMRKMTDDKIMSLPNVGDHFISTAITVLTNLSIQCLMKDDEDPGVYAALQACEITLRYGLSPSSPVAFVVYGIVEVALRNYDSAYRFGKLALKLLETTGSQASICPTVGFSLTLLTYRKEPLSDLKRVILRAGKFGLEIGDTFYGNYCTSQAMVFELLMGTNLHELENSLRSEMHRVMELGQDAMLLWFKPCLQTVLNMQRHPSCWNEILELSGEVMCEDEFILQARKANHPVLVAMTLVHKCVLAAYFRFYDDAEDVRKTIETLGMAVRMSYGQIPFLFSAAISNYELYRDSKNRRQLRIARKYKKRMEDLLSQGCGGVIAWYEFLCTVELTLKRSLSFDGLVNAYNQSISKIVHERHLALEGIMNEQAGLDLVRRGYVSEAVGYFERALHVYKHPWCCNGKYQWLLEETSKHNSKMGGEGKTTSHLPIGDFIVIKGSTNEEDGVEQQGR